jgi:hypothetical protein
MTENWITNVAFIYLFNMLACQVSTLHHISSIINSMKQQMCVIKYYVENK